MSISIDRTATLSTARQALLKKQLQSKLAAAHLHVTAIAKRPSGNAPLSFSQQQLIFLDQLHAQGAVYNFSVAVQLEGHLNIAALEKALNEIVRRHEALRTAFISEQDSTVQKIMPALKLAITVVDLRQADSLQQQLQAQIAEEANYAFDLTRCPLIKVKLCLLKQTVDLQQESLLLITMPHIITDGWSTAVLYRELITLYQTFNAGQASLLPELKTQYADFAYWQRQYLQPAVLDKLFAFWQRHLAGAATSLELPFDRMRPATQTYHGQWHTFVIPKEISQALVQVSRAQHVTLFALLFSAFNVLLHRYSGEEHICVGTPVANRNSLETESLIGFFVNTLALHSDLSGNPKFSRLLAQTHNTMLDAQEHQSYPFELLVEKLKPVRDLSINPLFQVMFVLHNVPLNPIEINDLKIMPYPLVSDVAKFDLTLHITETTAGLKTELEYNIDLFDKKTIVAFADYFQTLLGRIVDNPNSRLSELTVLTAAEQQQYDRWYHTAQASPVADNLTSRFTAQAKKNPAVIAIAYQQQTLTYAELNAKANQLAHYLQGKGVKPQTTVVLCVERSLEMLIGILGILKAGGVYVPIDPNYPVEGIRYVLADSQAALLLTQQHLASRLTTAIDKIYLDADWSHIAKQAITDPIVTINAANTAYLIYTSGSTGTPKGVVISHANAVHSTQARFAFYPQSVGSFLLLSSFAFDSSVAGIFWTLSQGGKLCLPDESSYNDPAALVKQIVQQVTHLLCLPSFYQVLLEQADSGQLDSLQVVIVAGESCLPTLIKPHYAKLPQATLYNEYGPTEATVWCSVYQTLAQQDAGLVPIGQAIANTQLYVLNNYLNQVPIGVVGEIYVAGAGLADGYLRQPALTAERFIANPFTDVAGSRLYKTGDRARYRADGQLLFLGRVDHQVKIRGFRIELCDIEAKLLQHPQITEAVVLDYEASAGHKRLVAYLVAHIALNSDELRNFLHDKLPSYMLPAAFIFLPQLPLTANGKLDRKALPAVVNQEQSQHFVAPHTPLEKTLAQIWQQVLGVENIGTQDNFFEIGGDSILSMQVISRAKQMGLVIKPRSVFEHQTIAALAKTIGQHKEINAEQGRVSGQVPLTPIQHWFFQQAFNNPHHWNQAVLLTVKQPIASHQLKSVMATLFEHHDVLRSQFYQCNGVWQQACVENIIQPIEIITVDLSSLPKTEHEQALENEAERWQQSLNLNQGLLYRLIWFTFGAQEDSKLLLIIHHLVIDGVSWRILLEDFNLLYQQLSAGINTPLTKKTTSFKQWSEQLTAYAQTQTALQNIAYWLETDWSQITPLPTDLAAGENTQASIQNISVVLDAAKTKALLQGTTLAYHCAFGDLLLTAVATALGQWLQSEDLLLELETHGREALFDELEISRTVGWFTSIFPMRLHVSQQATFYENAANIHKQLKVLKNNGLDYGIVRYLGVDTQAVTQLQAIPDPQIGFNYLGRLDQGTQVDGLFTLSQQASGRQNSPTGKRPHLLDIDAYIVAEQLHIHWHYSVNYHHQETIAKVAKQCAKSLEQASAYCLTFEKLYQNLPSAQNIDVNNPIETPSHNLTEDAILNATITPKNCAYLAQQPPRNILLTGATGFVGAFLLDELLRYTEATIFCLVRANDEQAALARIKTTLAGYKIQNPTLENRIIPLCGDLGKPLFGLSTVQFEYLSQVVDLIYHNAAFTHLVLPYQAVKPANVSGVSSILQLACTYKIKPVQYISTLSVFDDGSKPLSAEGFAENSLPSLSSRLKMGYSQSKLVAEHLLQQASARGLPVTIYRLGTITSHSSSGAWNRRDFHCSFLKVCIELGLFPDNKTLLALTPVDFISRSIVRLANLPVAIGQTYHVFNPQLTQTQAMLSWLAEFGYPLKMVPVAQWFAAFCEVVESHPAHPLYPLVDEIKGFIHTENTLMPYQHKQTAIALEFVGVDYPQVDKALFTQALNYLTEIGFFTEPVVHYATV